MHMVVPLCTCLMGSVQMDHMQVVQASSNERVRLESMWYLNRLTDRVGERELESRKKCITAAGLRKEMSTRTSRSDWLTMCNLDLWHSRHGNGMLRRLICEAAAASHTLYLYLLPARVSSHMFVILGLSNLCFIYINVSKHVKDMQLFAAFSN